MQYDNYEGSVLMGGGKQPLIQYFWLAVPLFSFGHFLSYFWNRNNIYFYTVARIQK